jgi:hypothetical protein
LGSIKEDTGDIVVEHKDHQGQKDKDAGLLGDLAHPGINRPPNEGLDKEEK